MMKQIKKYCSGVAAVAALFMIPLILERVALANDGKPRKVLIFTSSYGGGHDSAANAIAEALRKRDTNIEITIKDYADFLPTEFLRLPVDLKGLTQEGFEKLTRNAPWAWDIMFKNSMLEGKLRKSAGAIFNPANRDDLFNYIQSVKPDRIISTYFLATAALDDIVLKKWIPKDMTHGWLNNVTPPVAWIHTDYVDERYFWLNSVNIDLTLLPHSFLTKRWVERGLPPEKVATTGMAVNARFFEPFNTENKLQFFADALKDTRVNGSVPGFEKKPESLQPDVPLITIAGGKAGAADYVTIVKSLIAEMKAPLQIVALTGENQKALNDLMALKLPEGVLLAVEPFRRDEKPMKYMKSSTGYIVKSGGLSSTESAVLTVPTVLLDIMRGQEGYNSRFFRQMGLAEVVRDQASTGVVMAAMLKDPVKLEKMRLAQKQLRESITMGPIENFVFGSEADGEKVFCRSQLDQIPMSAH